MNYVSQIFGSEEALQVFGVFKHSPELVLLVGFFFFLLLRGRFQAALLLAFGATLCFANYYLFVQSSIYSISLPYAFACAGVSIILILLIVYQILQTV